jgi:hypothetical protein
MYFTFTLILFSSSLFQVPIILAKDKEESEPEDYGILNTFKDLTKWAIKEENIFQLAKARLQILNKESRMLEECVKEIKTFY